MGCGLPLAHVLGPSHSSGVMVSCCSKDASGNTTTDLLRYAPVSQWVYELYEEECVVGLHIVPGLHIVRARDGRFGRL